MRLRVLTTLLLAISISAAADPGCPPEAPDALARLASDLRGAEPCLEPSSDTDRAFDAELARLDLDALPASIDLSALLPFQRSLVAYVLERDPATMGDTLDRDALRASVSGRAVLGAFARGTGLDVIFLRRALARVYGCSRGFPATLDDFKRDRFSWTTGEGFVVDSKPKRGPRRLLSSPDGTVHIAETLEADGTVLETEIILKGTRADGALDFVVYDAHGRLDTGSEFPLPSGETRRLDAPYVCMACHTNPKTAKFDVVFPIRNGS